MHGVSPVAAIDDAVAALRAHKDEWARLPIHEKIVLLFKAREALKKAAQRWVDASVQAKRLDPAHFSQPQLYLAEIHAGRGDWKAAAGELDVGSGRGPVHHFHALWTQSRTD